MSQRADKNGSSGWRANLSGIKLARTAVLLLVTGGLSLAMNGLASGATARSAGANPAPLSGPVFAPGGAFLTDAQGRRLQFHGVNLVAKCGADTRASNAPGTPCVPAAPSGQPAYVLTSNASDPGRRFTAADAHTLRNMGFSIVRLGIIWAALEPGPAGVRPDDPRYCAAHPAGAPYPDLGAADPYNQATIDAYLRRVDAVVGLLAAQGIRVFIDMHQDAWGEAFSNATGATPWRAEGAPLWATCTSGLSDNHPARWQQAYLDPPVQAAADHFYANDVNGDLQGNFARVWSAVASHFRSVPDVVGYEVFNEPADPSLAAPPAFDRKLACFYAGARYAATSCALTVPPTQALDQGLIPTIQAADPARLVLFEAPVLTDYAVPDTVGVLEHLPFAGLVLSFHDYGASGLPSGSFSCTDPSCGPSERATMTGFSAYRAMTQTAQPGGPAWLMSEYGAEPDASDIGRVADLADTYALSWTEWAGMQLHDPTGAPGEGLLDENTRQPDPARAAVLARTYALATAGTPSFQHFDPVSGAYDLQYTADPAVTAPSEVVVPLAYHYPHGYDTTVTGATVTSAADAAMLTLVNQPGAQTVTLHLRAARHPRSSSLLAIGTRCRAGRVSIRIPQPRGARITRIVVYVRSRRVRTLRGYRITALTLAPGGPTPARVDLIEYTSTGVRLTVHGQVRGCSGRAPAQRAPRRSPGRTPPFTG